MPTCKLCKEKFKNHKLIDGKIRNLNRRKYCLECSPFNEHNTKQLICVEKDKNFKTCIKCRERKKIADFYMVGKRVQSKCKSCFNRYCSLRYVEKKKRAIKYLGGKCIDCGYDKHYAPLDFHHKNPKLKKYIWKQIKGRNWNDIKKELDKCELVCSNCHRIKHSLQLLVA